MKKKLTIKHLTIKHLTMKHLTMKQKILKALEEPRPNVISGLASGLFALSMTQAALTIQTNTLKEVGILK